MTIYTLFLYVALVAIVITGWIAWRRNTPFKYVDSFLQNFCGVLFVFSGFVKAVDPLGTAYKMEQYFTAFEDTCKGSFLKFMAPLFPSLSDHSVGFSIFMIVLEIVLGIMLIIGYRPKLSAWLFFCIMVFFTILTGFTYLTGYVPSDVNFFEFDKWTEFKKENMRVTDCGCFGDFIKLLPKVSFIKDLILLVPSFWFLFRWKHIHQLFSPIIRGGITIMSSVALILFCFSNYMWNEPMIDFRPFFNGADIKSKLKAEQKAQADVEITAYRIQNKATKNIMDVPYKDFLDSFKNNPNFKASWETLEQIKSEPSIPRTKVSDFDLLSLDGQSITEDVLNENRYQLMIVCSKVNYKATLIELERIDTLYKMDTLITKIKNIESITISKEISDIVKKKIKKNQYQWEDSYINVLKTKFLPLLDSVKNDGVIASAVFGLLTEEAISDLNGKTGINFPCYEADDLLLKTIMRSNPGLVLWKDGKIIQKWHQDQLPTIEELRLKYLKY